MKAQCSQDDICNYYYIHDKKLGEGGFAKVRLATHLATKQYVAIKCLDKIKLGPELPRIYNEIECLKKLKHKNIARLFQVFETETIIYLVLEYCAGGELFDYIVSKSKLEEPESAQIIYDLMRVLDYIHVNGFAHRDLKPENVLFDEKHQIKLIDFGLASYCSASHAPLDQLSTCCGSVAYAAPEIVSGGVYSGTSVDVWSAGIMLYTLLVGQLPFNDNNISKLYQKIGDGIKDLPRFLSPDASDLIRKMLTVDPKKRITVKEVLLHPWLRKRTINQTRISRRLDFQSGQLDEQLVERCREKFPHLDETKLREYIQLDFNYYSTTYYLMLAKVPPRSLCVEKRTPERRAQILMKTNNNNHISPTKRPPPERPVIVAAKMSQFYTQTKQRPDRQGPAIKTTNIHHYVTPAKKTRFLTITNGPKTPRTPPSYLRRLQETGNTSARISSPLAVRIINPAPFTPSKTVSADQENVVVASTPKKSIVKRLLESATPSKWSNKKNKKH